MYKISAYAVVVNSHTEQLFLLAKLLRKAGLKSYTFLSAENAWESLNPADPPSLIITDLHMPGMDGPQFCRQLRSGPQPAFRSVPILIVSAQEADEVSGRIAADLGAEAFFSFPLDESAILERIQMILSGESRHAPRRILIVEDSKTQARLLQVAFVTQGFQVDAVSSLAGAAEKFAGAVYDLAVIDYYLPDGRGDTLLDRFRAERPECICVMMTIDPAPDLAVDWMRRGAAAYVRKPYEPDYLLELYTRVRRERNLLLSQGFLEARVLEAREHEESHRRLFETMTQGVIYMDGSGAIVSANPAAERILGLPADQLAGRKCYDPIWQAGLEDGRLPEQTDLVSMEALRSGKPEGPRVISIYNPARGCRVWLSVTAIPLQKTDEKSPIRVYSIFDDITVQKQTDLSLREQRDLGIKLLAAEDLDSALNEAMLAAGRVSGMDSGSIYLVGGKGGLDLRCHFGLSAEFIEAMSRQAEDSELVRWAKCHPAFHGPMECLPLLPEPMVLREQFQYVSLLPVLHKQRLLAVMCMACRRKREFSLFEQHLLESIASQVGVFLERMQAQSAVLQAQEELENRVRQRTAELTREIEDRQRTEDRLRASEEKFRSIVECSPMAMHLYRLEADGQLVLYGANPTADRFLGIRHQHLLGRNIEDAFPSLTGTPIPEMYRDVALGRIGPQQFEIPYADRRFQGYFSVNVFQNGPGMVAVNFLDISVRRRMEEALRASEEKYRLLFNSSSDAIYIHDPEERILAVNQVAIDSLGFSEEELLAMKVSQVDAQEATKDVPARIAQLMQSGELAFESVHRRKDGSRFPVEVRARRIPWTGQEAVMSIVRDITRRCQAEEELRKLQRVVEQSPNVVIITDENGIIEYVNPSFEKQTGYSAAEALGRKPNLIKSGRHPLEFYESLWSTLLQGETWRGELCNLRKDGSYFWEIAAISPLRDPFGAVTHYVAIKEDHTERRRLAEELEGAKQAAESANQAKSQFLANMSHEIRTPMNAILGFSQLILADRTLSDHQRKQLSTITRAGEHLVNIINDILEMARIESGRISLNPVSINLHQLLEEVERMFSLRVKGKNLRFQVERLGTVPPFVRVDETKLRQVIINLLGNSLKFTAAGGNIVLRVRAEQEAGESWLLLFEVEDTGIGIGPEDVPFLFDPFFQAGKGKAAGGTGLGLPISREFVRLMGGEIHVQSRVGEGSCFRFSVRVTQVSSVGAGGGAAAEMRVLRLVPDQPPCRILVVDDQPENRDFMKYLLMPLGFEIRLAMDGSEAVTQCAAWQPHVVLMDLRLPVMDGFEATRRIREAHGTAVRVIAVSASVFEDIRNQAMEAGADQFLPKPVREGELLEAIRSLTGVEYIQEASLEMDTLIPEDVAEDLPREEDLARIPAELRSALREATFRARYAEMLRLVAQISGLDKNLGNQLHRLVERYEYDALQRLLSA